METAKITSKGQITIPKAVRSRMAVGAGDRLAFEFDGKGVLRVSPLRGTQAPLRGFLAEHVAGKQTGDGGIRSALRLRAARKHKRK